jgi:rRNA maturation endonuclease Nob1
LFLVMAVLSRSAGPKAIWGKLCTHCGTYMPNFAKFCPHCGRRADGPSQQ